MEEKKEKTRYWLKLEKNFLDSKYIKIIKNVPNGKDYILFYIALMLESVESVGHLRFTELVPYDEQMLSSLTDTNIDIVRSAMKMFQELGLITVLEDGTIFLPEVPRLTGKESESAERVRRFRARKQQEALQCNEVVTISNDNIEEESTENNEQSTDNNIPYQEIVDHLNLKAKTRYKHTGKKTKDLIKARYNEGFTLDDFKTSIDKKCKEWLGTEFEKYLRPETLFGTKFESYLNQKVGSKIKSDINNSSANLEGVDEL